MIGQNLKKLRLQRGLTQEVVAEMLNKTPQAISKWENDHTLPETAVLPELAEIYNCSVDKILGINSETKNHSNQMPLEENEEATRAHLRTSLIEDKVRRFHPNLGQIRIKVDSQVMNQRYKDVYLTVITSSHGIKLIERTFLNEGLILKAYQLLSSLSSALPKVYHIDFNECVLLMEDLNQDSVQGCFFDEQNEQGEFIRDSYGEIISSVANFHSLNINETKYPFMEVHWRFKSIENYMIHLNGLRASFKRYYDNEQVHKIPKVWNGLENTDMSNRFKYYEQALDYLENHCEEILNHRMTLIHGDLHPGNIYVNDKKQVKFIDFEALRVGLVTEDLVMLIGLHLEPDFIIAKMYYDEYFNKLRRENYSYDMFEKEIRFSVAEALFFPIKLFEEGIFDFNMRDNAIQAFETLNYL